MVKAALSTLLALFLAAPAAASELAREHLLNGDYVNARAVGLEADTVEGLNIVAEAMAAEIMLIRVDDAKDHAKAALDHLEEALDRDPGHVETIFLRALHTGFRTRSSSPFTILLKGLIGKSYKAIEAFEAVAPDDPRADALYGAWHLGIVRAAGDGKFGASLKEGVARYEHAIEERPTDIVILSNYAFALICLDDQALLHRAKVILSEIERLHPKNALERETKAQMMSLLAVYDDADQLMQQAEALLNTQE